MSSCIVSAYFDIFSGVLATFFGGGIGGAMCIDKQVTNSKFLSHLYESARRSLAVATVLDITDNIHPGHSATFLFLFTFISHIPRTCSPF